MQTYECRSSACSSVCVTPVSCQIKILVGICHLPENFYTLFMILSILTVTFPFLIYVSSLILSWLLILPLPTHCTKVKDTVHYYSVTYMLLIWRTLNDLFSYKNIVNSNSQYIAVQHVLFIYRGSSKNVWPRPSEPWQHGCFLVKTQTIGAAEDITAVSLPADPPAHGRQKE